MGYLKTGSNLQAVSALGQARPVNRGSAIDILDAQIRVVLDEQEECIGVAIVARSVNNCRSIWWIKKKCKPTTVSQAK